MRISLLFPTTRLVRAMGAAAMAAAASLPAQAAAPVASGTLPTGAALQAGSATVSQAGNQMTVTQSTDKAILNWQSFSIGSQAGVQFAQPGAGSAILNRVVGSDPSQLLGSMSANGKVFLVNGAGILVGAGARIDVGGFVASTLDISNADFLANRLNFSATGGAAGVSVEQGAAISTPEGGNVYLLGASVDNSGIITTPGGEVLLAAGSTVQLVDTGTPGVAINVTGTEGKVTNLGDIVAAAGRIGIGAALIDNSGALNASSVEKEGGRIFLRASKQLVTDASSRIDASGTTGGNVVLYSDQLADIGGDVAALGSAGAGGYVDTSGRTSLAVQYVPRVGAGGEWYIDPSDIDIVGSGTAGGTSTSGGAIQSNGSSGTAIILAQTISDLLSAGTSVSIVTGSGTGPNVINGPNGGSITVDAPIFKSGAATPDATLTMDASTNIFINASISDSGESGAGTLRLLLNAGFNHSASIHVSAPISLHGGMQTNSADLDLSGSLARLTLTSGSSIIGGPLNIDGGAALVIDGGSMDVSGATSIGAGSSMSIANAEFSAIGGLSGDGTLAIGNGNVTLQGLSSIGSLSLDGGSLDFNGDLTVASLSLAQGNIDGTAGTGMFRVTASLAFAGGSIAVDEGAFTQQSGDLTVGDISAAAGLTLTAIDGAVRSTGRISAATLDVNAVNGIALANAGNRIGTFSAINSGSGDIVFQDDSSVTLAGTVSNAAGGRVAIGSGGSIVQAADGGIVADDLSVTAADGIALGGSGNRLQAFDADNGSGGIVLVNTSKGTLSGTLVTGRIHSDGGDIAIDNTGGMVAQGLIDAAAGNVSLATHSPLTIAASGGVDASGNVVLSAGNTGTAADDLVLDGAINSANGSVSLFAGHDILGNAPISARNGSVAGSTVTGAFVAGLGYSSNPLGIFTVLSSSQPVAPPADTTPAPAAGVTNTVDQNIVTTVNNAGSNVESSAFPDSTLPTRTMFNEQTIGGTSGTFGGDDDSDGKPRSNRPLPTCT